MDSDISVCRFMVRFNSTSLLYSYSSMLNIADKYSQVRIYFIKKKYIYQKDYYIFAVQ